MEIPSEGTVGNSNGRLRAISGRQPRGKVTILRKKFSPPARPYRPSFFGWGDDPFGSLSREVQTFEDLSQRVARPVGQRVAKRRPQRCRSYRDAFRWRRFWGGLERLLRGKPENICSLSEGLPPLTPSGWKRGIIPIACMTGARVAP